jgi:hypothetical protein
MATCHMPERGSSQPQLSKPVEGEPIETPHLPNMK